MDIVTLQQSKRYTDASFNDYTASDLITSESGVSVQAALDSHNLQFGDVAEIFSGMTNGGVKSGGIVSAQITPDQTISVTECYYLTDEGYFKHVVEESAFMLASADELNPRYDLIYGDENGDLQHYEGTPDSSPSIPLTPAHGQLFAVIYRDTNDNTVEASNITDYRSILPKINASGDVLLTEEKSSVIRAINEVNGSLSFINLETVGCDMTGGTDNSDLIQSIIDSHEDGAVVLYVPEGRIRVDTPIELGIKTVLEGNGPNKSSLYAPTGNDMVHIDLTPDDTNPLIGSTVIKDIGFLGNLVYGDHLGKAIKIINTKSGLMTYPSELRYGGIFNVSAIACGYGIYIESKIALVSVFNFISISAGQYGIYSLSATDSFFQNIRVTDGKFGIYHAGGNATWSNIRSYWNGVCRYEEDYLTTYGIKFSCSRNFLSKCDVQENYYHGLILDACSDMFIDVIADSNGYGLVQVPSSSENGNGVVITNCDRIYGKIKATDHHTTPSQVYGLSVDSLSKDIDVSYSEDNQIYEFQGIPAINSVVRKTDDEYLKSTLSGTLTLSNKILSNNYTDTNSFIISGGVTWSTYEGIIEINTSGVSYPHFKYTGGNPAIGLALTAGHVYIMSALVKAPVAYGYTIQLWDNTASAQLFGANFTGDGNYNRNYLSFTAPSTTNLEFIDIVDYLAQDSSHRQTYWIKNMTLLDLTDLGLNGAYSSNPTEVKTYLDNILSSRNHMTGSWPIGDRSIKDNQLYGTLTWNPASLDDGAGETSSSITVTGAVLGDFVMVSAPYDLQGITCTAYVSASDTVKIRLQNETGGTIDLISGFWRVRVMK